VRISTNHHWAQGCTATIAAPPDGVRALVAWTGCHRRVVTPKGIYVFYWVAFDTAQDDGSGDGPYREAEIDADYLEPI
jgi:hypothetical protein